MENIAHSSSLTQFSIRSFVNYNLLSVAKARFEIYKNHLVEFMLTFQASIACSKFPTGNKKYIVLFCS